MLLLYNRIVLFPPEHYFPKKRKKNNKRRRVYGILYLLSKFENLYVGFNYAQVSNR